MTDRSPRKEAKLAPRVKPPLGVPETPSRAKATPGRKAPAKVETVPTELAAAESEPRDAREAISDAASAAGSAIASVASSAGDQVRTVVQGAGELAQHARQAIGERAEHLAAALGERPGARVRRVRRMAKEPLPVLWQVHPEARNAPMREVGIVEVPVEKICGTAQEVGDRGGDFLPLKPFRGDNWRARWQRILTASQELKQLPPVDLIRTGDEYWVVDGHNRVAAALYNGQLTIDANVMDLRLPGSPRTPGPTAPIAPYLLDEILEVRAAGQGRPVRSEVPGHVLIPLGDDHGHLPIDPHDPHDVDERDEPRDPGTPGR